MQEIISSQKKKQPVEAVEVSPDAEVTVPSNNETEETSENREIEFSPESSQDSEDNFN